MIKVNNLISPQTVLGGVEYDCSTTSYRVGEALSGRTYRLISTTKEVPSGADWVRTELRDLTYDRSKGSIFNEVGIPVRFDNLNPAITYQWFQFACFPRGEVPTDDGVSFCSDTDAGDDKDNRGTLTTSSGITKTDSCYSSSQVLEYYCVSPTTTSWIDAVRDCPSGVCSNGECADVTTPITCSDTDSGNKKYDKGTLTTSLGVSKTDYCISGSSLLEYYCDSSDDKYGYSAITCDICSNGECVDVNTCPDGTITSPCISRDEVRTSGVSCDSGTEYQANSNLICCNTGMIVSTASQCPTGVADEPVTPECTPDDEALCYGGEWKICQSDGTWGECEKYYWCYSYDEGTQEYSECFSSKELSDDKVCYDTLDACKLNLIPLVTDVVCCSVWGTATCTEVDECSGIGKVTVKFGDTLWEECPSGCDKIPVTELKYSLTLDEIKKSTESKLEKSLCKLDIECASRVGYSTRCAGDTKIVQLMEEKVGGFETWIKGYEGVCYAEPTDDDEAFEWGKIGCSFGEMLGQEGEDACKYGNIGLIVIGVLIVLAFIGGKRK